MGLTVKNKDSNYLATIVRLEKPLPHPNADKLLGWNINNEIVYTNMEYSKGDFVVHFPIGTKLNADMLRYFNLFANTTLNNDPNIKGYFHDSGVVKAVKLRGEPSYGVILKLDAIKKYFGIEETFTEGFKFDSFEDKIETILICEKYIPNVTSKETSEGQQRQPRSRKKVNRIVEGQFCKHYSTGKLSEAWFNPEDVVYITKKLHGTSGICANLLTYREPSFLEKIAKLFRFKIRTTAYEMIYASRNRIVRGNTIHARAAKYVEETVIKVLSKFPEGMSIYYEIVGYDNNKFIQKNYDYGCKPGQFGVYIYRITEVNAHGTVIEWPFSQVIEFCKLIPISIVPVLYKGILVNYMPSRNYKPKTYLTKLLAKLRKDFTEKNEILCTNPVPEEGICMRRDRGKAYKLKSFRFLELEGMQTDANIEDIS